MDTRVMRKVINFHAWPFRMEKQSNNRGARRTAAPGALLTLETDGKKRISLPPRSQQNVQPARGK